ncbi:MAG: GAF domain-containing protein [Anaerolineae bacterium]|nr:GAF domain-containing protein [Anaerolineae bacterium]
MSGELVLVIDDQLKTREFIANRVLAPHGYRSLVAADGQSGLQKAIDVHPDLIVFSANMSGFSGLQVLNALQERGRQIPTIAIVSQNDPLPERSNLYRLIDDYVHPPLKVEDVLAAIDHALSNSRLKKQVETLQERLQRQAQQQKILYVIAQAVTSPLEYQQVLNRLVEAAVYVTEADEGGLFLQDRESGRLYARSLLSQGNPRARVADQVIHDPLAQRVLDSGEPIILDGPDAVAAQSPVPALLQVPLKAQGRTIGVLGVSCLDQDSHFDKSSVYMLSVLAGYAAIAIENTQLYVKIEGELERTALYRISTALGSTLRLESVLEMVINEAIRLTTAERGYITLLDEVSGLYIPHALRDLETRMLDSAEFRFSRSIVHQVLDGGQPIHTTAQERGFPTETTLDAQVAMCVPILSSSGVTGAIYVDRYRSDNRFTTHQFDVLTMLSVHAGAAIENAKLFNEVEAEHRKLEAVIRGTDQPVVITDMDGTVLLMNSAARQAFSTRRAMGTGMLLPQVIEDTNLRKLFQETRASGHVQRGEIPVQGDKTFNATVTPISGVGFVAIMQDITQFKELSRLKSEFVATVSHDLRSPLSTVLSLLDMLDHLGPLNEQQVDFVDSAQQEIQHLIDLTSDLLDLGRLETDIDMEMKQCDMRDIVAKSWGSWQKMAHEKQHTFKLDLPEHPTYVFGNAMRLRQIVDNLINNAIKYTPEGGQISVHLAQRGIQVILWVQDSGIGIASEDQPYVFDRFFRVHNEQTFEVEGTGLGLAIAQSIVEKHQGRIWVESELEHGSTFYVTLPLAI